MVFLEGLIIALPALALTFHTTGLPLFFVAVMGAMAFSAVVSWGSYRLIFSCITKAPMVASLLAAISLAFLMRSVLAWGMGHEPRTFNLPLVCVFVTFSANGGQQ